jgi:hypothetical protein
MVDESSNPLRIFRRRKKKDYKSSAMILIKGRPKTQSNPTPRSPID